MLRFTFNISIQVCENLKRSEKFSLKMSFFPKTLLCKILGVGGVNRHIAENSFLIKCRNSDYVILPIFFQK
jgi:hypothetical protein